MLLRIINPCRSIPEPVCSQCPGSPHPSKHVPMSTRALLCCFASLCLREKRRVGGELQEEEAISLLGLCSCLLEERELSVCNLAIAMLNGAVPLEFLHPPTFNWLVIILWIPLPHPTPSSFYFIILLYQSTHLLKALLVGYSEGRSIKTDRNAC